MEKSNLTINEFGDLIFNDFIVVGGLMDNNDYNWISQLTNTLFTPIDIQNVILININFT